MPGLLIRLFRPNSDEFLEGVAHLDVVDPLCREVDLRLAEGLHDLEEQVLLGHAGDVRVEAEAVDDVPHVRREARDVTVEVRCELVRIVQQPRHVEL